MNRIVTLLVASSLCCSTEFVFADDLLELERRITFWESKAYSCPSELGDFPAKDIGSENSPFCDDGDSVLFNALLCRSGDPRGCEGVRNSQDEDGRFWRSPNKRLQKPDEPPGMEGGQTTFSGDQAKGLIVYFAKTRDAVAFRRWISWIDSNQRCLAVDECFPHGTPRYCKNNRCALRVGDCQILSLLGRKLAVGVPFCTVDPLQPVPTVSNVAQEMKQAYDDTLGKLPFEHPGLKLLRDNFDEALRAYEEAIAPVEALRTQIIGLQVELLHLSQLEAGLSAILNDPGFSRHNAVLQIMTLEDLGYGMDWMHDQAVKIAEKEPLNPFFQYVATRRGNKNAMLPLILSQCPSSDNNKFFKRHQWAWEREPEEQAWKESMLWDCLFIASLYKEQNGPPNGISQDYLSRLHGQLGAMLLSAEINRARAEELLLELQGLIDKLDDPEGLLRAYSDLVVRAGGLGVGGLVINGELVLRDAVREAERMVREAERAVFEAEKKFREFNGRIQRAIISAQKDAMERAKKDAENFVREGGRAAGDAAETAFDGFKEVYPPCIAFNC
ncbi:hypothetical protein [Ruegeria arenilitoris]|uniref:hypothetical protein n=1 Tax=Ruegeria arenilitoris TaxID=1173585 RepID=UPI00147ACEC5|nr:hypothetical protein [Ruegeria arenilitoris]